MSADQCLIRDVKLRGSQLGPVIVNFEHGKLNKDEANELKCSIYSSANKSKSCTITTVAPDADVFYHGDVQLENKDVCRNFLAVRNKRTNKMRIYEANHTMLSPSFASSFINISMEQDYKTATYNLSHAFGSKKSKRAADQQARMEVNVDSVKEKLSTTVNDVIVKESDIASVQDDGLLQLLPPCDRNASTPADVYPISGLLKKKEIENLVNYYSEAVQKGELDMTDKTPLYLHLSRAISSENTELQALLLYADTLAKFCSMRPSEIKKKGNVCPFSNVISNRITKNFLNVNGFQVSRSQSSVDKAILHIIILALYVGGFKVDLDIVAQSVKGVDLNRIRMLARALGTVPTRTQTSSSKNLVVLKVPLPPQQSLLNKTRKSRR